MNQVIALAILGALFGVGCAVPDYRDVERRETSELQDVVRGISPGRPITAQEAEAIARLYHRKYVQIEGVASTPQDKGASWESIVLVGVAAIPNGSINIEKEKGRVSSKWGPTLEDPRSLANEP